MGKVVISGAGLVGSLLASFMAKRGHQVDVYERRPDMRKAGAIGGRSINLALSDRGLKALDQVGLADKAHSMALPMHGRMVHLPDGEANFQPYGKEGQYINSISRAGLNEMLMDHAEKEFGAKFHFESPCKGIDKESKELLIENSGQTFTTSSDMIFGADGAFSAVREAVMKNSSFNYQQFYLEHGYKELTIPPGDTGDFRMDSNALHIWPRKSFMLIALPNLDSSFTVTLFLAFEGKYSFANLQTEEQVTSFFNEQFADAVPLMPNLLDDFFANPTSSLVTVKCSPWVWEDKITLMGDASHAVVPFYGQGMNSGFEDCTVLDDILDQYSNQATALKAFRTLREPDGAAIADLALRNFIEMRDLVSDERFLTRKKIEKQLHKNHPDQFVPLYSMVTFSHQRFSEALSLGQKHDQFFDSRSDLAEVAGKLDTEEGKTILNQWLKELTKA